MKLLIPVLILLGGAAQGQTPKVLYEKKIIIDLDGDTIEGDLTKPDAEYIVGRIAVRHWNLIKPRQDFNEKVLESASDL